MAVESDQEIPPNAKASKDQELNFSFSIWPPSQRTRDAVVNRLVETLSGPSYLSKRYGSVPPDEAMATARIVEEQAFAAGASRSDGTPPDFDDAGIEVLQFYSKEISKRMLGAVKAKAKGDESTPPENVQTPPPAATPTSEEISSHESESSQP